MQDFSNLPCNTYTCSQFISYNIYIIETKPVNSVALVSVQYNQQFTSILLLFPCFPTVTLINFLYHNTELFFLNRSQPRSPSPCWDPKSHKYWWYKTSKAFRRPPVPKVTRTPTKVIFFNNTSQQIPCCSRHPTTCPYRNPRLNLQEAKQSRAHLFNSKGG